MKQRQSESEDGSDLLIQEEICSSILLPKSGYIRGRGAGPKPNSSLKQRQYQEELEKARRRASNAEQRAEETQKIAQELIEQVQTQKSEIHELRELLQASQRSINETMQKMFEDMVRSMHVPNPFWMSTIKSGAYVSDCALSMRSNPC